MSKSKNVYFLPYEIEGASVIVEIGDAALVVTIKYFGETADQFTRARERGLWVNTAAELAPKQTQAKLEALVKPYI